MSLSSRLQAWTTLLRHLLRQRVVRRTTKAKKQTKRKTSLLRESFLQVRVPTILFLLLMIPVCATRNRGQRLHQHPLLMSRRSHTHRQHHNTLCYVMYMSPCCLQFLSLSPLLLLCHQSMAQLNNNIGYLLLLSWNNSPMLI
jgi:hypothetical protein